MTSAATTSMAWGHRLLSTSQAVLTCASRNRSTWRWSDVTWNAAHPNKKHHLSHRKHWFPVHTYGVQRESYLRCVDNSKIGREAMAEGRPPYIINVYSPKHRKKPHGAYGKLGDKVICAVRGEKIKGVIVGLKAAQLPGVPRFDTNNVVLVQNDGSPLGTRIHAPIPNCIRPSLKKHSTAKNVDFTKLLSIATKFV